MGHLYIPSELAFASFLLLQLFPALTAWRLQSLIKLNNIYERMATSFFIYSLIITVYTGLLGVCSILSPISAFALGVLGYTGTWYATRNRKLFNYSKHSISFPEKILVSLVLSVLACLMYLKLELPELGTDALMYHLYIPATWIQTGHIFRIPFPDLYVQYYSCYGEMMYAWYMLPSGTEALAKVLPYIITAFIFFTMISTATALGFKKLTAVESATCIIFLNTIIGNASVSNTDLFVGYFLLSGTFLYLRSLTRKSSLTIILSGLAFGLAFGTKLLGILLTPAFCIVLLAGALISSKFSFKQFISWAASAVAAACPFYIFNWISTGNPIYPLSLKIFGMNIFNSPIDTANHNRNSFPAAWDFFVSKDIYSINFYAAIALLSIVLISTVACLFHKRMRSHKRMCFWTLTLTLNIVLSIILLISFYSKDGHARQIIPVLLLFPIPLCAIFRMLPDKIPFHGVTIAILLFANAGFAIAQEVVIFSFILTIVVLLFLNFRNRLSYAMQLATVIIMLVVVGAVIDNQLKCCNTARNNLYKMTLPTNGEIAGIIAEQNKIHPNLNIACSGMNSMLAMGPELSNRVTYIPVTHSGKLFPHEYMSPKDMRAPAQYAIWKERLLKNKIDYLVIDFSNLNEMPQECPEFKWATTHSGDFKPVGQTPKAIIFRFISRKQD